MNNGHSRWLMAMAGEWWTWKLRDAMADGAWPCGSQSRPSCIGMLIQNQGTWEGSGLPLNILCPRRFLPEGHEEGDSRVSLKSKDALK